MSGSYTYEAIIYFENEGTISEHSIILHSSNRDPTSLTIDNLSIYENVDGAIIGNLSAVDPDGDTINFSILSQGYENILELNGSELKLKDDFFADFESQEYIDLTVGASDEY